MSFFDKFKKVTEDIRDTIDESGVIDKAKKTATEFKDQTAARAENYRKNKEKKAKAERSYFERKHAKINAEIDSGKIPLLEQYSTGELIQFTEDFYEKIMIAGSSLSHSYLTIGKYIKDKELIRAKNEYAKNLDDSEELLLFYPYTAKEGFILTNKNLYYCMKDVEGDKLSRGQIKVENIQRLETIQEKKGKAEVLVNNVSLFYLNIAIWEDDYLNLKDYFERLRTGDFEITQEQISMQIESKLDEKLLARIKGFMYDDEIILYIAWGLDSLTAKDYIVCTSKRLLIINREAFGLGEHIKQFEYQDIRSISTAKSVDGDLFGSVLATAFKQTSLEIYSAGTNFRIETILRIEAEKVIKIVNDKKRMKSRAEEIDAPQEIIQETPKENPIDQIVQLAQLKDQGILSEEEFEKKKTKLLGRI